MACGEPQWWYDQILEKKEKLTDEPGTVQPLFSGSVLAAQANSFIDVSNPLQDEIDKLKKRVAELETNMRWHVPEVPEGVLQYDGHGWNVIPHDGYYPEVRIEYRTAVLNEGECSITVENSDDDAYERAMRGI